MGKQLAVFISVLLLVIISSSMSNAEDMTWKFVAWDKKNGDRYFYQIGSVMQSGKDRIGFKMMVIRGDASKSWSDSEIDCRLKIMRDLRTKTERSDKFPVFSNFPSSWRSISFETYGGAKIESPEGDILRTLCR